MQRTKMRTAATHSFCMGPYFFIFCLCTGCLEDHSGFSLCIGALEALSVPGIPLFLCVLSKLISKSTIKSSNQWLSLAERAFDSLLNISLEFSQTLQISLLPPSHHVRKWPYLSSGRLSRNHEHRHCHCLYLFLYSYIWPPGFATSIL